MLIIIIFRFSLFLRSELVVVKAVSFGLVNPLQRFHDYGCHYGCHYDCHYDCHDDYHCYSSHLVDYFDYGDCCHSNLVGCLDCDSYRDLHVVPGIETRNKSDIAPYETSSNELKGKRID